MRLMTPATCRRLVPSLVGALALTVLVLSPGILRAEDGEEGKKDEAAPAQPEPRKPILPLVEADPKAFKDLVEAARVYFDLEEEQWKGRSSFVTELEKHAAEGRVFLKDMEALRWLVYEGRSFDPQLTNRKWQKAMGVTESKDLGGTIEWIRSDELTLTYSVPKSYWSEKDLRSKYPRMAPLPMLLTMHDKRDYTGQKYPGKTLLDRRYAKRDWESLYDEWIILCPVVAAGNYLDESGMVRSEVFRNPFAEFWRHYHIDYDRIVLDGSEQAFAVATSMPVFFAGIVFQHGDDGKWGLKDDKQKDVVRNFASVPVYVVNNPELAQQLRDAGHSQVTAGVGGKTLEKWLAERRRVLPKTFSWSVQQYDQVLPYWVNLDGPNWSAAKREVKVNVNEQANCVEIEAVGINDLSLFLNDDIVDLDRKVRITINGHVEFDEVIEPQDKLMAKVGRDFDFLFNREPVRIRESMFFGWLTPSRVVRLMVRPPRAPEPAKDDAEKKADTTPKASAEEAEQAAKYLYKAKIFAERGNKERAIEFLQKVLELPESPSTAEAQALLEKLK